MRKAFENICHWIERRKLICILLLFLGALAIRLLFFRTLSYDYWWYLRKWYSFIVHHGRMYSWKYPFHNYQMPYIYLLTFFSYLPLNKLYVIKLLSVLFDFIAAWVVFKIVKIKYKNSFAIPFLGAAVFLFTPTVILNSAWWAQCDVIYTTFLLLSGYYCLKEKNILSLLFFGIAFAFKAQAVFFAPVLFILWYKKRFNILYFLIIPGVYFLSILPAMGMGRHWKDLLTIYVNQSAYYHGLSMNAPNFYALIPNDFYDIVVPLGMAFACCVICLLIYWIIKQNKYLSSEKWIEIMLLFLLVVPYTLPKMHERFFFPADVFSILYLFFYGKRYHVPILIAGASLITYWRYGFSHDISVLMFLIAILMDTLALGIVIKFIIKKYNLNGRFSFVAAGKKQGNCLVE